MQNIEVMFSSKSNDGSTPQDFFDKLDEEFHFTLDPCADKNNYKVTKYYTEEDDGLLQDGEGETCFVNPPYSNCAQGAKKSYTEGRKPNTVIVLLVPARTDTKWFHQYVYNKAEIRFIKGRLKFGNSKNSAPFPSMLVIYKGPEE